MSVRSDRLIELLVAKQREDPDGFHAYLPGVAELLPDEPPTQRGARPRAGLTEHELAYHREGLSQVLAEVGEGTVTANEAAKGLQHCANLIRDDGLDDGVGYEEIRKLLRAAIGKSPGSFKSITTVSVGEGAGPAVEDIPAIRGVLLQVDREGRLVAVDIHPGKLKERRALFEFVGASRDPQPDVAARHDDYLALQDPHGAA